MEERAKLHHLLEHWLEHNREHYENYAGWAAKAEAWGDADLAAALKEIADRTRDLDAVFERAINLAG